MILSDARSTIQHLLGSEPYDRFFSQVVGREPLFVRDDHAASRAGFLGDDPRATLTAAYATHGSRLTCHAHAPSAPPPSARAVTDAGQFAALVHDYHSGGYTVRIPDVVALSPRLQTLTRALELVLRKPVEATVFWSAPGARAPVHYDEYDILLVQLHGSKRWFVSTDAPGLNNQWKLPGETPPKMERYRTDTMECGDLAYLPRGTPHTVESLTESVHLSIGFVPLTLRDAVIAAVDLLADLDRPLRANLSSRADASAHDGADAAVPVRAALERLVGTCDAGFVREAMDRRLSRMIVDLPKLTPAASTGPIAAATRLRHSPLAVAHLATTPDLVDFAQPGAHVLVHRGVEESLRFIAGTPVFRVADIPGAIGDDIRVALAQRFVASGFLEIA